MNEIYDQGVLSKIVVEVEGENVLSLPVDPSMDKDTISSLVK